MEDKLAKRYEVLDRLIELLSHGEARVKWTDKVIVVVEDIKTPENCRIVKS
jgi:hypothetical protein